MPEDSATPLHPAAPTPAPVPRWAWHRRLYDWSLSLAHHRHATAALFLVAFAESSFFPIPPDVLQIAMTVERRSRAWFYAAVSTLGSVLGGVCGWLIGWGLWHLVSDYFFRYIPGVTPERFAFVQAKYLDHAFLTVFTAAFTPIPYKVFTIAGGVAEISLLTLVAASILGRGGRFFLLAALLWWFGPPVKRWIERYFNLITLAATALIVAVVVVIALR
ncbi:MAG TPA: YqaA family protein [Phycisphaerales bacterium]|nr:YqaA family protein [Phycisphaerales bacterium]